MSEISVLTGLGSVMTNGRLLETLQAMRRGQRLQVFAAESIDFADAVSQRLFHDAQARRYPELQALAFWLRRSAVLAMRDGVSAKATNIRVPQGVVFHIPPGNVEAMFGYSLFMALLCGNASVVRLPTQRGPVMLLLLKLLNEALLTAPALIREQVLIVGYAHDNAVTEFISRFADLRVIWGGDATVTAVRQIPLAPQGRELIFPDRFSWSAFDLAAYQDMPEGDQQLLAERVSNDLFWFDQMGCSSPRMIVWRGARNLDAVDGFYRLVAGVADQQSRPVDIGGRLARQTRHYETMADFTASGLRQFGPQLAVFSLNGFDALPALRDRPCFGGTLHEVFVERLTDLVPHLDRRDQTLSHAGFSIADLQDFARAANGKGIDRIVPAGEALSFDRVWDGYDLIEQMTRHVTLKGTP